MNRETKALREHFEKMAGEQERAASLAVRLGLPRQAIDLLEETAAQNRKFVEQIDAGIVRAWSDA